MKKTILSLWLLPLMFVCACNAIKTEEKSILQSAEIENGFIAAKNAPVMEGQDYVAWVQDMENGFKKEKTIDDLTFSVQYKPYEYIVFMEEKKDELPDTLVKRKMEQINDMQYYNLKITLNESAGELLKYKLTSQQQYQQRVSYFSFDMQNDVQLVNGNDTLPCILYHFERAYDIAPSGTFVLGFPLSKNESQEEEKTLLVYDRTFHKGLIKFTFRKKELRNLPKLKTI
ncbi:MAG: hypothetical protein ACT4ON_15825 [Bacteroidota bacterium]